MSWRSDIGLRSWESPRTMSHDCASIPSPATGVTVTFQDLSNGPKVDSTSVKTIRRERMEHLLTIDANSGVMSPNYWLVVLDLLVCFIYDRPVLQMLFRLTIFTPVGKALWPILKKILTCRSNWVPWSVICAFAPRRDDIWWKASDWRNKLMTDFHGFLHDACSLLRMLIR